MPQHQAERSLDTEGNNRLAGAGTPASVGVPKVHAPEHQLEFAQPNFDRLTHYLFKYPAKFHPPVARSLVLKYSRRGDWILDPFCGSGTSLVEAAVAGRNAAGSDLDPVAVFVSRIKTHRYDANKLASTRRAIIDNLSSCRRSAEDYLQMRFIDVTSDQFHAAVSRDNLWVPAIPNLFHWFRKYVILDLAHILKRLSAIDMPATHRDFFLLCFASIIRPSSNADPVPVSGLEVTSYMKKRDARGRTVDPFGLYEQATARAVVAAADYGRKVNHASKVVVKRLDALKLHGQFRRAFDGIITSPPYHNAVDYYRRHQLEMYWLGFTHSHADRLALKGHYLGRPKVPQKDDLLRREDRLSGLAAQWEARLKRASIQRANAFRHYVVAMKLAFGQFAQLLKPEKKAVIVAGHSCWNSSEIPTVDLFAELAAERFAIVDYAWYPIRNRYMSYSRRNGANISREHILVMQKRSKE